MDYGIETYDASGNTLFSVNQRTITPLMSVVIPKETGTGSFVISDTLISTANLRAIVTPIGNSLGLARVVHNVGFYTSATKTYCTYYGPTVIWKLSIINGMPVYGPVTVPLSEYSADSLITIYQLR